MGAVFAGIIRAPITSVLIIFEMTGSYALILPLMIANMSAYALARHWRPVPVYEALLEQDGVHLPHRRGAVSHALEQLRVAEAMTTDIVALPAGMTVAEALERTGSYDFSTFPVVDDSKCFVGLISEARLRRTLAEGRGEQPVLHLVSKSTHVFPDQPIVRAVIRMNQTGARQLPVLNRKDANQLVGLLTMSDIVRAHARAALDADVTGQSATPEMSEVKETLKS